MSKIPTIEELLKPYQRGGDSFCITKKEAINKVIEITKLHVQAALEAVYEKGLDGLSSWDGNPYTGEGSDYLDKNKIINAYPLSNIK